MILRKASPEEAHGLTELALRSKRVWGYDDAFMQRVMPDMIVHPEFLTKEHGIVAEEDGVIFGYAIVRVKDAEAFLRDLFVEAGHFRQGIGRALFDEAVRYSRENRAQSITLGGDPNAIGFYEKLGMRQIGSEPSIAGEGRVLPVMTMNLAP